MQHRTWGFAAVGVATGGLCAVLATTVLASSDHGTERQAIKQSQTAAAKPGASFGVKPVAGSTKQSQTAAQQPAKTKVSSSDGTKSQMSEENQLLLKMQIEIRATTSGPTAAQVTKANKLVGQLKAEGRATAAQLAWLALTPAQKRVEAAPVGTS
ncbi:hypothetical protein FNV64_52775 [Streptomyces sp. S1A1-7]|uniref:hypothetical protein n=1 Tax=Streptomyces sp. S1A1-7 TaxID=2594459 RepID=UPI001163E1A2|nr:hypothetical protein [Streptomyces sp. S1A1-7]QDN83009.1 hypothetical protein FNV64_52775 [Streptomyces sp. S1A1-7]